MGEGWGPAKAWRQVHVFIYNISFGRGGSDRVLNRDKRRYIIYYRFGMNNIHLTADNSNDKRM